MNVNYVEIEKAMKNDNHIVRGQNQYGYGAKISTKYKVKINNIWRRVYCSCFSNVCSFWVIIKNEKKYIDDLQLLSMI